MLLLVGAWSRIFILESIWFVLLGSLITGFSYNFINAPAKVAILWFGKNERAIKMSIITLMLPLGGIIAHALPDVIIPEDVLTTATDLSQGLTPD